MKKDKASSQRTPKSSSGVPQPTAFDPKELGLCLGLALLAFAVYANSLSNGFVSDDNFQLLRNPLITDYRRIPDIFLKYVRALGEQQITNYYRPVQMLVYMGLYYVAGFRAFDYHLFMVLIHVANTLLIYSLARHFLKNVPAALVAGALFAVHPIHTEAVMWVAALPDVLSTMLVLLAVRSFARQEGSPRGLAVAGYFGLCLGALLTKETGAMLLPLLAGYECLYLGRSVRDLWKNKSLYAALLAALGLYLILRWTALGALAPAQNRYHRLRPWPYFFSVVVTMGQYLGKLILPTGLQYFHPFEPTGRVTVAFVVSFTVLLLLVAAVLWFRGGTASFGIFWVLVTLAPVMNLTGLAENVFAERYLYLPSAGFVCVAGWGWQWLAEKQKPLAWGLAATTLVAGSYAIVLRNPDWKDDLELFSASVKQAPRSAAMHGALAWAYSERRDYDRAAEQYRAALQFEPDRASFHMDLANALAMKSQYQEAAEELRRAIRLKPEYPEAHLNLGQALESLGDREAAAASYQRALDLKANFAEALTALGLLRLNTGDTAGALELFHKATAARPGFAEAHLGLGMAYNILGEYAKGAEALRQAIEAGSRNRYLYLAHYHLGVSYSNLNAPEAAAAEFRRSYQLRPDFQQAADALRNTGASPR